MKKTISICLEEDTITKIDKYIKDNKISSRSAAAERIFNIFFNNNKIEQTSIDNNDLYKIVRDIIKNINNEDDENIKIDKTDILKENIKNGFAEMPD